MHSGWFCVSSRLFVSARLAVTHRVNLKFVQLTKHNLTAFTSCQRLFTTTSLIMSRKALLLGVYENGEDKQSYSLTKNGQQVDTEANGRLTQLIEIGGPLKKGKVRTLYDISSQYPIVTVVGLGPDNASYNEAEEVREDRENIRNAVASGAKTLREIATVDEIVVDDCGDGEAAAEGAYLGLYYFDELKQESLKKRQVKLSVLGNENQWKSGQILATGQNTARRFMELPANLCTPTRFSQMASELLTAVGVKVIAHDRAWAESQKMGSYLSVAKGSDEPPVFLEMHYNNAPNTKPLVFVGKGITFDSGGISLKPSSNMDKMRADMGGAANVVSTILTLASIQAKVNVIGLTPLCENLPSGRANKPGDVVVAMNGKTIQVDNTDAEGRLILADALCYAHTFEPQVILDIATLTGAMGVACAGAASGIFTTQARLYSLLQQSGTVTGDRVWRMPLFKYFTKQVTDGPLADLLNIGKIPQGGACNAAAFLREFVTIDNWVHVDMAGVMHSGESDGYHVKGMSGRPMRTLVRFAQTLFEGGK